MTKAAGDAFIKPSHDGSFMICGEVTPSIVSKMLFSSNMVAGTCDNE